jgi:hypothetical protein
MWKEAMININKTVKKIGLTIKKMEVTKTNMNI